MSELEDLEDFESTRQSEYSPTRQGKSPLARAAMERTRNAARHRAALHSGMRKQSTPTMRKFSWEQP